MSRHSRFTLDIEAETLEAASTFHVLLAAGEGAMAVAAGDDVSGWVRGSVGGWVGAHIDLKH